MLSSITWTHLSLKCKSVYLIAAYTHVIPNTETTGLPSVPPSLPFFPPARLGNTASLSPLPFCVLSCVSMTRRHLSLMGCFYQYPCFLFKILVSFKILLESNFPVMLFGSFTFSSPCMALIYFLSHLFTPSSSNLYPCLALVF